MGHHLSVSSLGAVGLDPFDEQVYRLLLTREASSAADLVRALGEDADDELAGRVAAALDCLYDLGLVGHLAGTPARYAAIDPATAVDALVRARTAELEEARTVASDLSRLLATARSGTAEAVQVVHGAEELGRWFVRVQQEASEEMMTLDRPPYALTTANPVEVSGLARGVAYRAIYSPDALEWPGVYDDIRHLVAAGEQARVLPRVRIKLAIADRRLALLPLSLEMPDVRAVIIRRSTLLDALIDFWDLCWERALPLATGAEADKAIDAAEAASDEEMTRLMHMLVAGLKDEAIARQLGWSVRTMRRRVSALHERLGATNRFQLGALAVRRGLLP
jgi:DNA-binding CsgD family transcriptional regulator